MNWKEIQEKYPKGWAKLDPFGLLASGADYLNPRDLYDFFDEQKIYIEAWMVNDPDYWCYTWQEDNNTILPLCCYLDSSYLSKTFGTVALKHISLINQKRKNSKMVNLKLASKPKRQHLQRRLKYWKAN